jgi:hypothetical protein
MGNLLADNLHFVSIKIPSILLVTASAGLGCVYAYSQGS